MAGAAPPAQGLPQWPGPHSTELDGDLPELDSAGSSDGEPSPAFLQAELFAGQPTDELARRLREHEESQLRRVERLRQRRRQLKTRLASQKVKEREFVAQMEAHMDDIDRTEQELGRRVWQMSSENARLRAAADQQAREGVQQAERLAQSTKQVGDSEARVQFLVDRIIALLSGASGADSGLTEALASARQRERVVLRQLEEARRHFDEVQRQNGELTMRLTEELGLSRRLSDQLVEMEERFFGFQAGAAEAPQHAGDVTGSPGRLDRLGLQTPGLRGDHTEAPPELLGAAGLPGFGPGGGGGAAPDRPLAAAHPDAVQAEDECAAQLAEGDPEQLELALLRPPSERGPLGAVPEDVPGEGLPAAAPAADPEAALLAPTAQPWEVVLPMEEKLREALDDACFSCPVVRVETGVYNFGPLVRAVVELRPTGEVVAMREGRGFEPIDEFIRNIPQALVEDVAGDLVVDNLGAAGPAPVAGSAAVAADEAAAVALTPPISVPASWRPLGPAVARAPPGRQDRPHLAAVPAAARAPSPRFLQAATTPPFAQALMAQARYVG